MIDAKWHGRSEIDSLDIGITPHLKLLLSSVELLPELNLMNPKAAGDTLRRINSHEAKLERVQRIISSLQATMQSCRYLRNSR